MKISFFKNSLHDFQSIKKQIQSVENASIDPTPIEHRSKQTKTHKHFLKFKWCKIHYERLDPQNKKLPIQAL